MRTTVVLATLLVLSLPALADMEQLEQFLHEVEAAEALPAPLRADGTLTVATPSGTRRTAVVVIVRPPTDTYIELRQSGTKLLLLNRKGTAYRLKRGAGKAEALPATASVADSDFTRGDLAPFRLSRYAGWRISDETASEMTVTLFPKPASHYSLVVTTFDRDKRVPLKTLYYRDTLNNLVKMERDGGYVMVGRKWLPTTVSMETFALHTHSTVSLRWTQNVSFPPELFDPVFLTHASPITWPAAGRTPGP
jgi:Outer membrane lipoprotein-sorting protein